MYIRMSFDLSGGVIVSLVYYHFLSLTFYLFWGLIFILLEYIFILKCSVDDKIFLLSFYWMLVFFARYMTCTKQFSLNTLILYSLLVSAFANENSDSNLILFSFLSPQTLSRSFILFFNRHNSCIFMVYNVMFQYMYTLWNKQVRLINISVGSCTYHFFVVRTFKFHSFSNFEVFNMILSHSQL